MHSVAPPSRVGSRHRATVAGIVILLVLPALAWGAAADGFLIEEGKLRTPRHSLSAVFDGEHAYVFGGLLGAKERDHIHRFDPETGEVSVLPAKFSSGRHSTAAVWTGTHAFVLGGTNGSPLAEVVRFTPATGEALLMPWSLPYPVAGAAAVWTGESIVLFGGHDGIRHRDDVVILDPATGVHRLAADRLPVARSGASAVFADGIAYVFGGENEGRSADILAYDAASEELSLRSATLPTPRAHTAAFHDGFHAFVVGGDDGGRLAEVVRYDPARDETVVMAASLPIGRSHLAAAWTGSSAHLFGGCCPSAKEVQRYSLAPGAVMDLAAEAGFESLRVTWTPPDPNTHSAPVRAYELRVGETLENAVLVATLPGDAREHDVDVPAGASRVLLVRAVNEHGAGPDAAVNGIALAAPGPVRDLVARAGPGAGDIRLAWLPPEDDGGHAVESYRVYAGAAADAKTLLEEVPADVAQFIHGGLADGVTRHYHVTAVSAAGEGAPSNDAFATTFIAEAAEPPALPAGLLLPAAAFDGANVLVLGGLERDDDGERASGRILRYDVAAGTISTLAQLPSPRYASSAASDGARIFLAGGAQTTDGDVSASHCHPVCVSFLDEVLVINFSTGTTQEAFSLPTPRSGTSSVFDGESLHIFGGLGSDTVGALHCHPVCLEGEEIVSILVESGLMTRSSLAPGEPRFGTSAVWTETEALVFGGTSGSDEYDQILRFDPATGDVTLASATLPSPRAYTSAAWDGQYVYVIGGIGPNGVLDEVVRYDPLADEAVLVGSINERWGSAAVWTGHTAIVLGGDDGVATLDDIVLFRPEAPQNVDAQPGPGAGEVTLTWDPPVIADDVVAYRIYRGDDPGSMVVVAEVDADTRAFVDGGLDAGTTYHYRVSALTLVAEGPQSLPAAARTWAAPSAPRDLTATSGLHDTLLEWAAPEDDGGSPLTAYHLYRAVNDGDFELLAVLDANTTTYVDETCLLLSTCRYIVRAVNLVGEGEASNEVSARGTGIPLRGTS